MTQQDIKLREDASARALLFVARVVARTRAERRLATILTNLVQDAGDGLRHALELHGLRDYFVTLQTADDAPSKPHPEMLLRAMREAGADAADTVLVGDTSYDMAMARSAGAHAFGVDWGYHEPHLLRSAGAHLVLSDFAELAPAADALWTGKGQAIGAAAGGA